MYKQLIQYAKKYRLPSILAPLFMIAEVLLEVQIPFLMSKIVDVGIAQNQLSFVLQNGFSMMFIALCAMVCGIFSGQFAAQGAVGFASELRKGVFYHVQNFSFSNIDHYSIPGLITRLTTDITNIQQAYMMVIRVLVRGPVMVVAALIMATLVSPKLISVFLLFIPAMIVAIASITKKAFPLFGKVLRRYDQLNAKVQENLRNIRVIKNFVREDYEEKKFKTANDDLMNRSIQAENIIILSIPLVMLTMNLTIVAILWFGGNMVISRTMQVGQLIGFIAYVGQIVFSLMSIAQVMVFLVITRASIDRVVTVLNENPDITDIDVVSNKRIRKGEIVFKDVCFQYDVDAPLPTLNNINLKIEAGSTVAIVGATGSSKTTLIHLIPRLYDVNRGEITIDGVPLKAYTLADLRKDIAVVLQNNTLFSGTIAENLRWGHTDATLEELIDVSKVAQIHDFIQELPKGYDTPLGQGGVNLSGGQKQRLCIARALLKKPKILILDDSTSAIDSNTESKIQTALKKMYTDTTVLIVAQRIASIVDSDQIILLHRGELAGSGTHGQLLETSDIYKKIYQSQGGSLS
ncbi:MAG: ABC transporter ATP-binding protein [Eubacteriaceae bacterium]|jgi:ATP-binding cassette subfamily B protein|nr:ABC transporter ATP-binding protein [Eubacteriaceae bacterium]